jgi:hypothetical protein
VCRGPAEEIREPGRVAPGRVGLEEPDERTDLSHKRIQDERSSDMVRPSRRPLRVPKRVRPARVDPGPMTSRADLSDPPTRDRTQCGRAEPTPAAGVKAGQAGTRRFRSDDEPGGSVGSSDVRSNADISLRSGDGPCK